MRRRSGTINWHGSTSQQHDERLRIGTPVATPNSKQLLGCALDDHQLLIQSFEW
jgi:hypothetical protein